MKLMNLHEDVVDLGKRRKQKHKKRNWSIQKSLHHIDQSVTYVIEDLMQQEINEDHARRIVMKHLSDLVMSYDVIG